VTAPAVETVELKPVETILLAEDESGIRALMRKILQKQGYEVLEAEGGQEAIAIAASYPGHIHLLLTDVVMPGMNGGQLAAELKTQRPDLRVLYMSGYTGNDLAAFEPLPADAEFLQKPFSLAALLEKVRGVLSRG
jgi:DNA-binding NtrC family response regulator